MTSEEITGAVVEDIPNTASSSRDYVVTVTEAGQLRPSMEEARCIL